MRFRSQSFSYVGGKNQTQRAFQTGAFGETRSYRLCPVSVRIKFSNWLVYMATELLHYFHGRIVVIMDVG
jgi:hypothetical protein